MRLITHYKAVGYFKIVCGMAALAYHGGKLPLWISEFVTELMITFVLEEYAEFVLVPWTL